MPDLGGTGFLGDLGWKWRQSRPELFKTATEGNVGPLKPMARQPYGCRWSQVIKKWVQARQLIRVWVVMAIKWVSERGAPNALRVAVSSSK